MDNYTGEIRVFPYNKIPQGWVACQGQTLQIGPNQALFALIGTKFGGNGTTTFCVPNLQGVFPVGEGGPLGLAMGVVKGDEKIALDASLLPPHTHAFQIAPGQGSTVLNNTMGGKMALAAQPANAALTGEDIRMYTAPANPVTLMADTISSVGGAQPHSNLMPYLPLQICIATTGLFPSRA